MRSALATVANLNEADLEGHDGLSRAFQLSNRSMITSPYLKDLSFKRKNETYKFTGDTTSWTSEYEAARLELCELISEVENDFVAGLVEANVCSEKEFDDHQQDVDPNNPTGGFQRPKCALYKAAHDMDDHCDRYAKLTCTPSEVEGRGTGRG